MKHDADYDIGVAVIDSYTHYVLQYLEGINKTSKATMGDFVCYPFALSQLSHSNRPMQFTMYDPIRIRSHPGVRSDLFQRPVGSALVTDFFGGVADVDVIESHLYQDLEASWDKQEPESPPRLNNVRSDVNASRPTERVGSRLPPRRSGAVHEKRAWTGLGMVGLLVGFVLFQSRFRTGSSSRDSR